MSRATDWRGTRSSTVGLRDVRNWYVRTLCRYRRAIVLISKRPGKHRPPSALRFLPQLRRQKAWQHREHVRTHTASMVRYTKFISLPTAYLFSLLRQTRQSDDSPCDSEIHFHYPAIHSKGTACFYANASSLNHYWLVGPVFLTMEFLSWVLSIMPWVLYS